ncbi:MAG TPA: LuxR C-terminal-related transcriptional regulator, partial [Thermomicrobiales bacterium]
PTLGGATEAVLDSLPEPGLQLRRLIGTLINDLVVAPVGPFVLVLDDLHAIGEAAIHAALDQLLERLPDDAHVVIATRYDPPLALARLRARGQLAELRLEALRFSPAETGALLNDRLALALPPGEVLLLHGRVEGWAAGLRLLALMLGRLSTAEERRALVTRLGEEGRYIFDFLAEEVLGQQEPELQRFLLDTSILPELAPALCRAVTGRDDAADLLDLAYRRNLFLTLGGADDGLGTTFRFHDLFAAFLRGRLQRESPERIRSLHGRAGDASADPARAIAHYCAAERWDEAARIIEERGADFARHGMYRRLHDWIVALPPDVREARPRLLHLLGAFAFYTGAWEQARPLLERAETGLLADEDRARAAESTMLLISIADRSGDTERAAVLTARMRASGPLPPLIQIFLDIGSAWQGIRLDDYATVDGAVTSSVDLLLASDDPAIWNVVPLAPPLALGPAGPTTLERYCHAAPRRFNDAPSLIRATAEQLSGYLHFLRGRLDEAAAATDRAQQLVEQLRGLADVEPGIDQIRFALALIRVGPIAAGQYIDRRLPEVGQNTILRMWLPGYRYLATKAHWLAGHADEARAMAEGLATGGPFPDLPIVSQAQALLAGLLAMSAGRYEEAERQLRAASAFRPPYYTVLFWLDHPQLLLALCYERWGRPREAMMTLRPVLEECERLDTPGIVLKVGPVVAPLLRLAVERGVHAAFAARTLHILEAAAPADPATASVTVPDTGETLSPREVEVLRLLADGASNATIADALFISPNTVKTHVARLLAKLGVASRTAAAARARDLGVG